MTNKQTANSFLNRSEENQYRADSRGTETRKKSRFYWRDLNCAHEKNKTV